MTTAIQHDESRFNDLMKGSYKKVYNLAFRLSGNRADAEDLTQEAFYRAYRGFNEYEGDRPFENWIFRIVTRLFLDLVRSRKRRVSTVSYDAPVRTNGNDDMLAIQTPDPTPGPDVQFVESTMSEEMQKALMMLKPDQRSLVMLADVEGASYQEIAAMIDAPVGTVRSRLHRAHKRLKAALEHQKNCLLPTCGPNCLCAS